MAAAVGIDGRFDQPGGDGNTLVGYGIVSVCDL